MSFHVKYKNDPFSEEINKYKDAYLYFLTSFFLAFFLNVSISIISIYHFQSSV